MLKNSTLKCHPGSHRLIGVGTGNEGLEPIIS